jgi:hypothetical protein
MAAAAGSLLALAPSAWAQSDNFDDGNDDGWIHINPVGGLLGGTTTYSFPDGPTGKGYRIQCTTSALVPGTAGTGRSFNLRTNEYTDFFVAADVINWDDQLNQAIVLAGRFSGEAEVLDPCPLGAGLCNPGFGVMDGYVANYDPRQHGASASSRLGGQFQINRVLNENPAPTFCVANVVLTPGKSYRFTFRGVGPRLTAEIFDHEDLTTPIVSIETDQGSEFTSGKSGLIAFSRDRTTADMVFDNYFASEYDPFNPPAVPPPATAASLPGIPQVVSRIPASRFTNFHPPASGISFTTTNIGGSINASAVKLYLNDVSANVNVAGPAEGPTVTYTGTLADNTLYAARLELENADGTQRSTNRFWFDTFSDGFLETPPTKVVEAEDYNFSLDLITGGLFQDDPPISGIDTSGMQVAGGGSGFYGLNGADEVDYSDRRNSSETDAGGRLNAYRPSDHVGTQQGDPDDIQDLNHPALTPPFPNDHQRAKYVALNLPEYQVVRTEVTEWLNYTRTFEDTNYHVYLRVGSMGNNSASLDFVTSDPAVGNQTTFPAGRFVIPNTVRRSTFTYVPLVSAGEKAVLKLSGLKTLRLTQTGTPSKDSRLLAYNYLLFVPTSNPVSTFVVLESSPTVEGPYTNANASIDYEFRTITVPQSGKAQFYRLRADVLFSITSTTVADGIVTIVYGD